MSDKASAAAAEPVWAIGSSVSGDGFNLYNEVTGQTDGWVALPKRAIDSGEPAEAVPADPAEHPIARRVVAALNATADYPLVALEDDDGVTPARHAEALEQAIGLFDRMEACTTAEELERALMDAFEWTQANRPLVNQGGLVPASDDGVRHAPLANAIDEALAAAANEIAAHNDGRFPVAAKASDGDADLHLDKGRDAFWHTLSTIGFAAADNAGVQEIDFRLGVYLRNGRDADAAFVRGQARQALRTASPGADPEEGFAAMGGPG